MAEHEKRAESLMAFARFFYVACQRIPAYLESFDPLALRPPGRQGKWGDWGLTGH